MKEEALEFTVHDQKLRGNIYWAEKPKNLAVLFLHGWTGRPNEDAAKFIAENGYCSMTFSLSGHNDSEGRLEDQTRQKSLQEVLAAYDYFVSKLSAGTKICVAGNSYGGYLALLLSSERSVDCLQLRVPANYIDEGFEGSRLGEGAENPIVAMWRKKKLNYTATRALSAMHNFVGQVQILEAELDDTVPHQTVQNYADALQDKSKLDYHLMKGWPHSMGSDKARNKYYQEILLNWLNKQL